MTRQIPLKTITDSTPIASDPVLHIPQRYRQQQICPTSSPRIFRFLLEETHQSTLQLPIPLPRTPSSLTNNPCRQIAQITLIVKRRLVFRYQINQRNLEPKRLTSNRLVNVNLQKRNFIRPIHLEANEDTVPRSASLQPPERIPIWRLVIIFRLQIIRHRQIHRQPFLLVAPREILIPLRNEELPHRLTMALFIQQRDYFAELTGFR